MATTPHQRAMATARKQRQRARDKAIEQGRTVPLKDRKVREATYRPTRAQGKDIVSQAHDLYRERQKARNEVLAELPSAQNPQNLIDIPRQQKTAAARLNRLGPIRQAEAIRTSSNEQRLVEVGRSRRNMLQSEMFESTQSDQYAENMSIDERIEFQEISEEIAKIPLQALGILFNHEGGESQYSMAIGRLVGSGAQVDVEDGLNKLRELLRVAKIAGQAYSPATLRKLGYGNNGNLTV